MSSARNRAEDLLADLLESHPDLDEAELERCAAQHPEYSVELRSAYEDWVAGQQVFGAADPRAKTQGPVQKRVSGRVVREGDVVADYRLVCLLGEGGMGQVWEAEQLSLERRVALKFVRSGLRSRRQLEFFQREARAGGRPVHPGIVAVYDWDDDEELAWIAQELVSGGRNLRHEIAERFSGLELPARHDRWVATLIAKVADALAVVHAAGVLHRDVKPANILLTPSGEPKLTDFGLARIDDESGLSVSGEVRGTYNYMSPEQVSGRRNVVGARSDVFGIGVVLYELLTGRRPFEGDTTAQIAWQILNEDPQDPRRVRSQIPTDLVVIASKALEKEPQRRYACMSDFADDLRRFVDNEPILAQPSSTWSRAIKWTRRNPTKSALLTMGSVSLVVFGLLWARSSRLNRDLLAANRQASRLNEELGSKRDDLEESNAALRSIVDRTLDLPVDTSRPDRREDALELFKTVATDLEGALGVDEPLLYRALGRIAVCLSDAGRVDDALALRERVLEERTRLLGADHRKTIEAAHYRAALGVKVHGVGPGLPALQQSVKDLINVLGADHHSALLARRELGVVLTFVEDYPGALENLQAAATGLREQRGIDDVDTLSARSHLGHVLSALGRRAEPLDVLRDTLERQSLLLGRDAGPTTTTRRYLADFYLNTGDHRSAEPLARDLVAQLTARNGRRDPGTLRVLNMLGRTLSGLGQHDEAEAIFRELLDEHGENLAPTLEPATVKGNLARLYNRKKLYAQALELYLEALSDVQSKEPVDRSDEDRLLNNVAVTYARMGDMETASKRMDAVIRSRTELFGDDAEKTWASRKSKATMLMRLERFDKSTPLLEDVFEAYGRLFGPDDLDTLKARRQLGESLCGLGRTSEGLAHIEAALESIADGLDSDHAERLKTLSLLADERQRAGDTPGAEVAAREALQWTRPDSPDFEERRARLAEIESLGTNERSN